MRIAFFTVAVLIASAASAQTAPASPELQAAAVVALQQQRNNALDQAAALSAQLQVVTKELTDLKAADAKKTEAPAVKPEPQK